MSGPLMFFGVGVALEGSGLLLAVIGFRATWRDFAKDDERFFEPVHRWTRGIRAAGAGVAAGLSGRRDVEAHAGIATGSGRAGGSVSARVRPGPLTPATDLATFAAALTLVVLVVLPPVETYFERREIGRASCRERV